MPHIVGETVWTYGNTRIYLDKAEVARALDLNTKRLYRIEDRGELLEPDIIIGLGMSENGRQFHGYDRDRVIRYGQATGRLDDDGQPLPLGSIEAMRSRVVPVDDRGLHPEWYYSDTRYYLSRSDLSTVWGIKPRSVSMREQRGQMPEADVAVNLSMQRGATYGYDPDRIAAESVQYGMPVRVDPRPYVPGRRDAA